MSKFKVTFTLDEADANYFRSLYSKARKATTEYDPEAIIRDAREIVQQVRSNKKTPQFVVDSIDVLADLTDLIQDEDYAAPQKVKNDVLAAIAYFSNPEDLIPDHIPGLGYLDDAIMVKFIEEEFKHELWGYRKFCKQRDASEQRPWARAGKERLRQRLDSDRQRIRAEIATREAKEAARKQRSGYTGW